MFVVRCKVLHFNTHWRSGKTWLQNSKAHKNEVASQKVYEFSRWVFMSLMTFKIKLVYPLGV